MILHVATPNKFTVPFFLLVQQRITIKNHKIITLGDLNEWPSEIVFPRYGGSLLKWMFNLFWQGLKAEKIILHGIFDPRLIILLFAQPWLLPKCYWVMLGADLYVYRDKKNLKWKIKEFFRRPVIRRMGYLVTYIKGDYVLAQKWYGAIGQYYECLMYPSNVFEEFEFSPRGGATINILVGNSAASSNRHLDAFEKLRAYRNEDINIYCPLSYGDKEYAESVISAGKEWFGDKFKPITYFMPFDQYQDFLGKIDIAIFNHGRQQAMGNLITLLGMGKRVYLRDCITSWDMFQDADVKVYNFSDFDLELMDQDALGKNRLIIKRIFSEHNVIRQLKVMFEASG